MIFLVVVCDWECDWHSARRLQLQQHMVWKYPLPDVGISRILMSLEAFNLASIDRCHAIIEQ